MIKYYSRSIKLHYSNGSSNMITKYNSATSDGVNCYSTVEYTDSCICPINNDFELIKKCFTESSDMCNEASKHKALVFESTLEYSSHTKIYTTKKMNNAYTIFMRLILHRLDGSLQYEDVPFLSIETFFTEINLAFQELLSKTLDTNQRSDLLCSQNPKAILAPRVAAFFVHEVIGHLLEYDFASLDDAVYGKDAYQTKQFIDDISIYDDPLSIDGLHMGQYDDDGHPLEKKILIQGGYLVDYITTKRCASFYDTPLFRMSNLFLASNPSGQDFGEMVASSNNGDFVIYSCNNAGVNPLTGDYMLICGDCGYVNEKSVKKATGLVTILGNAKLSNIIGVGKDYKKFFGVCLKQNQAVLVGSGSPSIILDKINISK